MNMVFILLKAWTETKFDMVSSIYITLAKVYDILIDLVTPQNGTVGFLTDESLLNLSGMMDTIYVLAGIFMLFKVTISALQLLLDPDQMRSGNNAPGKIITRIVTSLALLILFVPSGIIFGDDGWARKLESAIINSIPRMIDNQFGTNDENLEGTNDKFELLDTVNASKTEQICYFLHSSVTGHVDSSLKNPESKVNQKYTLTYSIEGVYLVKFYKGSTGATDEVKIGDYAYVSLTQGKKYTYKKLPGKITGVSDDLVVGGTIKCPKSLVPLNDGSFRIATFKVDPTKGVAINGYSSYAAYQKALEELSNKNNSEVFTNPSEETLNNVDTSNSGTDSAKDILDHLFAFDLNHDEAQDFAISVAKSFQQCNTSTEECEAAQASMFIAPDNIVELIDNDQIKIDTLTSIIVGIVVIVYLLFLCVEVIIRRFKLMLLEMISPLPIISYADPNDKHFSEWLKMYGSVYADLFLKLFAIKMAIVLMDIVLFSLNDNRLLVKFFYIVALLLFAKAIPDMLSKLFGISMTGSFKDIFGMSKKVLGVGANAVGKVGGAVIGAGIGGAIGAMTAEGGKGNKIIQGLKGGFRGLGSGWNKKPLAASRSISAENATLNQAIQGGSTFLGRAKAKALTSVGLNDEYTDAKLKLDEREAKLSPDKERKAKLDNLLSSQKGWEKSTLDQMEYGNYNKGKLGQDENGNDIFIQDVEDWRLATAESKMLDTNFSAGKDAWYNRQYAKRSRMIEEYDNAMLRGDVNTANRINSELDAFERDIDAKYNLSESEFRAMHDKELNDLHFDAGQSVLQYTFHRLSTDPTYEGPPGDSKEQFEQLKSNLQEVDPTSNITDYKGDTGLKKVAAEYNGESLNLGTKLGQAERKITEERRQLEESAAKFDHDMASGQNNQ